MVKENHPRIYARHYHKNTTLQGNPSTSNENTVAIVVAKNAFEDGRSIGIKLLVEKKNDGNWKIVNGVLGK